MVISIEVMAILMDVMAILINVAVIWIDAEALTTDSITLLIKTPLLLTHVMATSIDNVIISIDLIRTLTFFISALTVLHLKSHLAYQLYKKTNQL